MTTSYKAQSLFEVKDLVAVITGGGSGLGKVMAHALADNGAKAVYILGRREDALTATKDSSPKPEVVHPVVCDVTSKDSLSAAAERVRKEVGYCDVVFANSGIGSASTGGSIHDCTTLKSIQQTLWDVSMEDYTKVFHVNVAGTLYTVLAFLELLDEGNRRAVIPQKSQVIVTSSVAGFVRTNLTGLSYSPSKAAATQMAKQLATVLAPYKIRVNTIAPGVYPSEMTDKKLLKDKPDSREEGHYSKDITPLERSGREEEIAGIALFLTSQAGGYINGNVLVSDGGSLCIVPSTY